MRTTTAVQTRRSMMVFPVLARRLRRCGRECARRAGPLLRSRSGTSAVEFSLLAPAFATIVLGISQVSDLVVGATHMQAAVRTSIQYGLDGGTDMTAGAQLGLAAWQNKPGNATLMVSEYCTCNGTTTVCTQTCSDGAVPNEFVTATAAARLGGTIYYADKMLTETARVR
ncbi:MAG: pilus assembly protein [Alphaproteobacteria bacterium]|nr:pilus assembly protein [Alphaproteobacteria bacterium]